MTTVLFAHGDAEVEVNGPRGDQSYTPVPRFVRGQSQAGHTYAYQTSDTNLRNWSLEFPFLTDADQLNLQDFFDNEVAGPSAQFTYTHTDGVERPCRFVNTSLPFQRVGPNQWSLGVTLEVDDAGGFVPSSAVST
ncbi:hypothetical protein [Planctomyces sp. SH-PL14]|uniref:hypothetical protein n=1 Tax=Planctomyces sp. SH-PL14 TaxID=1632864 RepID=UPI00078D5942|nr:hypothetical protein [Planctomyces sp. SH-PL14]AMV20574.1 hypothetical protein VT03_21930 [Planctomyces sp. SH-PL14]